ncbi:hypothetical protein QYE76_066374 [Lolium multiflorum]|uniref:TF-B3 domain-containing protein n=1 Tax=Lolium multiflorum TaxID=4521 RepID=A0AAD8SAQ2_LOLMU|nr:hypothetical protein QYE76_066374 [Lolium multiflorum]
MWSRGPPWPWPPHARRRLRAVVFIVGHGGGGAVQFEFVLVLKGDPRGIQRLPDTFADFVAGDDRPGTMHLWEAACGYYRWIVDVIYDPRGKMYLHIGWEKFARHHRLQAGFVLLFSYFGDRDMSVKVFDKTRCRRNYHGDSAEDDDD